MIISHVEKYDQANDRPKLAMLAITIGPMIDRGLDDNIGPILAYYTGSKIAPDYRPKITARLKPFKFIMILIMTIKFKTLRIINTN